MFEPVPNAQVTPRYRLVREIGRGGMGSVWEAYDTELDAACALKFILNQDSKPPEVRGRFLREARAVARLHSPHAVGIRGVGEWEGALYIAMELLVGETLFARLARTGALSTAETSRIVEQLGSVLTMAHQAGFVHRDLKPENVWLCGDNLNPKGASTSRLIVKLLDFGVAKQVLDGDPLLKTATGLLVGTPYYMSPEQAGNRQIDYHSDLWSLAVIAVECLTGQRVFDAPALYELLDKIVRGPTPKVEELYRSASPSLIAWWSRATSKTPQERHDSAAELADEFSASLVGSAGSSVGAKVDFSRSPPAPTDELPSPPGQPGPMTLTTPGDGQANPWKRAASPAATESVGPLSSTQAHTAADEPKAPARTALPIKFAWLLAAAGLSGSAWWVIKSAGETDSAGLPPVGEVSLGATGVTTPSVSVLASSSPTEVTPTSTAAVADTGAATASTMSHATSPSSSAVASPTPLSNAVSQMIVAAKPKSYPSPAPSVTAGPALVPVTARQAKPQAPPKPSRSGL